MSREVLIVLAVLIVAAAVFGLRMGLRAVPPGETEIILTHAERYAQDTGRPLTDCYARPAAIEGVRLVVICEADGAEPWAVAVDRWGQPVEADTLHTGPRT